jgi:hypothetical protein
MNDLKTALWAQALIRRAEVAGASAFVARKGDADAGDMLVKVATLDGQARLYAPSFGADGARVFVDLSRLEDPGVQEAQVDRYIARRVRADPDLWVVEIEDRAGRHFLTEAVA